MIESILELLAKTGFPELFKGKETKKREFEKALADVIQENANRQIEVNVQEAQNKNIFVSGWRPFIGWVCGFALFYNFVLHPLLIVVLGAFGASIVLPVLELGQLVSILIGMLGLSGLRSYEKTRITNGK